MIRKRIDFGGLIKKRFPVSGRIGESAYRWIRDRQLVRPTPVDEESRHAYYASQASYGSLRHHGLLGEAGYTLDEELSGKERSD